MSHDQRPLPAELPDDSAGSAIGNGQDTAQARPEAPDPSTTAPRGRSEAADVTRAGMVWVGVIAGLAILVLLIIFILQNQDRVEVHFFGIAGELSIGMALFIAAVAGGILVAIAGAVRILQLRRQRRRRGTQQPSPPGPQPEANPGPSGHLKQ